MDIIVIGIFLLEVDVYTVHDYDPTVSILKLKSPPLQLNLLQFNSIQFNLILLFHSFLPSRKQHSSNLASSQINKN